MVTPSTGRPVAIRRIRPATRTMKNSSRLLAKMAMKRTRSSSGTVVVLGQLEHALVEPQPASLPLDVAVRRQVVRWFRTRMIRHPVRARLVPTLLEADLTDTHVVIVPSAPRVKTARPPVFNITKCRVCPVQ